MATTTPITMLDLDLIRSSTASKQPYRKHTCMSTGHVALVDAVGTIKLASPNSYHITVTHHLKVGTMDLQWLWNYEPELPSFWRNFHHWMHWEFLKWQLPVQPVMKISSLWRNFRFSRHDPLTNCYTTSQCGVRFEVIAHYVKTNHYCDVIMCHNHRCPRCLLDCLFRCWSNKTSKLRVTGFCEGNSPVTGDFPRAKGQLRRKCFYTMTSSWWFAKNSPKKWSNLCLTFPVQMKRGLTLGFRLTKLHIWLTHWGDQFTDISNVFHWIKILNTWISFHWNIFAFWKK